MIVKNLELQNIRSYKREKIDFPEGVTLFEGDIGSGKSTILYAIEFALFGLGDLKSGFMLRNGADEGAVTLTIDIDGVNVVLKRTLERKKTGASQKECIIVKEGARTEYSPEEMKREVLKILKFNENPSPKATSYIYRYAVFTPQEAMKEILELKEDARLETLRRAFGIEEYRTARNNSSVVSKHIRERMNFLLGSLKDYDSIVFEKNEKSGILEKKKSEYDEFSAKKSSIENFLSDQKTKMSALREKKAAFDKLEGEIPRLNQAIYDRKKALEESEKSINETEKEISKKREDIERLQAEKRPTEKNDFEISSELKNVRDKMNSLSKSIGGLEKSISETNLFEDALKSAESELSILDKRLESIDLKEKPTEKTEDELLCEIKRLRSEADKLRERFAVMKDSAKKFKDILNNETCPFCEQKIDPGHFLEKSRFVESELEKLEKSLAEIVASEEKSSLLKERLLEYSRAKDAISSINKEREMLQKNRESSKAKLLEIGNFKSTLARNTELYQKLTEDESRLAKFLEGLKNYAINQLKISEILCEIETLNKRIDNEQKKSEFMKEEISKISSEYESKKQELEHRKTVLQDIEGLEKKIKSMEDEKDSYLRKISALNAEINAFEKDLDALSIKIEKKEAEKKEKEGLSEMRAWLDEYFSNALVSVEQHVLMSINEEFNTLFQKWFGLLMAGAELNVSINDAFTPMVVQNGYEQDIRALSGGEKTSVALAYRLALNTVVKRVCSSMASSGLIILDEPTDGFSKEQLNHLRDVFEELSCRQIILVSHERELEAFSDRVFRVVKEGSVSRIVGA